MTSKNPIVQKALNATAAKNAKFAVTTKSGRSVVIEASDYKAAEKEAYRRFGAGCIVDLIANSEVATNAKFKIGDWVIGKFDSVPHKVTRVDGSTMFWTDSAGREQAFASPWGLQKCDENGVVAMNAYGDERDYYVVDEFGNAADGSQTPLPFDIASALFLKLTGSKKGNGKWGILRKGESVSRARDWYGNIVSWNAKCDEKGVVAYSKNPIVQNALNATAANTARDANGEPIKVGKFVWLADSSDGVMREVIKIEGNKVYHKNPSTGNLSWDYGEDLIVNSKPAVKNAQPKARAKNAAGNADDFAANAGDSFKEAYQALERCVYYLERLSVLGKPNDVKGNDGKIQSWAIDKLSKVRDIKTKCNQGRL